MIRLARLAVEECVDILDGDESLLRGSIVDVINPVCDDGGWMCVESVLNSKMLRNTCPAQSCIIVTKTGRLPNDYD